MYRALETQALVPKEVTMKDLLVSKNVLRFQSLFVFFWMTTFDTTERPRFECAVACLLPGRLGSGDRQRSEDHLQHPAEGSSVGWRVPDGH